MKWEDIKTKLLSRRFWIMLTTFVGLILVMFNVNVMTVEKFIGVITSFSILAIYILGETITDIANRQLTAGEKVVVSVAVKLTSRKFWAALISFITTLMFTLGVDALTIEQVEGMIMAIATVAIYILGESAIDASKIRAELNQSLKDVETEKETIMDEIIGNVAPVLNRNWVPMYVFAPNGVCSSVFDAPDYLTTVMAIAHMTQIFVEPNKVYGEENDFFKFVTSTDNNTELYIPISDVVDGNAAEVAKVAEEKEDDDNVIIGYAAAESVDTEATGTEADYAEDIYDEEYDTEYEETLVEEDTVIEETEEIKG